MLGFNKPASKPHMNYRVKIVALAFFTTVSIGALADPLGVRIEIRCPEKTIEFMLTQRVTSTISKNKIYVLAQDGSAVVHIRFIAAPVRTQGENENKPPLGVALAVLGTRKSAGGTWDVVRFSNSFVPLEKVDSVVEEVVTDMLK